MPAIENMRMHLLEETTVRTEWTRAPGSVDAYEIQFIPTVREGPSSRSELIGWHWQYVWQGRRFLISWKKFM